MRVGGKICVIRSDSKPAGPLVPQPYRMPARGVRAGPAPRTCRRREHLNKQGMPAVTTWGRHAPARENGPEVEPPPASSDRDSRLDIGAPGAGAIQSYRRAETPRENAPRPGVDCPRARRGMIGCHRSCRTAHRPRRASSQHAAPASVRSRGAGRPATCHG